MDLHQKRSELIDLIDGYLKGIVDARTLSRFAWNTIEFFQNAEESVLPPACQFEREFWYAIWQVQHLVGEKDEDTIRTDLEHTLDYLRGETAMPRQYRGCRP